MSESVKPDMDNEKTGSLTSEGLRTMVIEHLLKEMSLFIPEGTPSSGQRLIELVDSMSRLGTEIATQAIVNRQNLSPLNTFAGKIDVDPDIDDSGQRYELGYRIVEQIGDAAPHLDKVFTYDEAVDAYEQDFVDTYWGSLGENCPKRVTAQGERHIWFTVVRYPAVDNQVEQSNRDSPRQRPDRPR